MANHGLAECDDDSSLLPVQAWDGRIPSPDTGDSSQNRWHAPANEGCAAFESPGAHHSTRANRVIEIDAAIVGRAASGVGDAPGTECDATQGSPRDRRTA